MGQENIKKITFSPHIIVGFIVISFIIISSALEADRGCEMICGYQVGYMFGLPILVAGYLTYLIWRWFSRKRNSLEENSEQLDSKQIVSGASGTFLTVISFLIIFSMLVVIIFLAIVTHPSLQF